MLFQEIKHILRVWLANLRTSAVREMEFRANFISGILRQFFWLGFFLLFISVIFNQTNSLGGWSQSEVMVILALSRIIEGIMNALFIRNIMQLSQMVQQGQFDIYLIRPLPSQFLAAFRLVSFSQLGNIIGGIGLLVYSVLLLPTAPNLGQILLFLILAMVGIIIYYSILITIASLVFKMEKFEAMWAINGLLSEPLTVPFEVFPRGVRVPLTYLLPIAFVVYVPAQSLVGRLNWHTVLLACLLCGTALLVASYAWRAGLRRYTSASS